MQDQLSRAERWRRFATGAMMFVVGQQVIGWLLWREPLTTRIVPAIFTGLLLSWYFTFGPPWRRR